MQTTPDIQIDGRCGKCSTPLKGTEVSAYSRSPAASRGTYRLIRLTVLVSVFPTMVELPPVGV
jgi:hypothetical protein